MSNSDSAFLIGKSHKVCEDYAIHKDPEKSGSYVIVCDGCSSSQNSDFAARLLAHAAEKWIDDGNSKVFDGIEFEKRSITTAVMCSKVLGEDKFPIDATLLTAIVKDNKIRLRAAGDGVFILGRNDGGFDIYVIEFPRGYPCYPSYLMNSDGYAELVRYFKEKYNDSGYSIEVNKYLFKDNKLSIDEECSGTGLILDGEPWDLSFAKDIDNSAKVYNQVLITTDGLLSFSDYSFTVPLETIFSLLLQFKGFKGEYVSRRLNKFVKDCAAKGWWHFDDLTLAGIYFGEDS